MKRIRVAVRGSGFMGRVHRDALRRLDFIDICALDDPALDAVHICTPNAMHFQMVKDALDAGRDVLCEKPLTASVEDARKLVVLAQEKNLRNCTCHNLRYYPMVQQMREMRERGDLGEILIVQGTYSQDWLLYETDWNWRMDPAISGPSRAMADIGSHWCDMAEHVTGQRITALCADLQTFHKNRETEDFGAVIFRMGERTRGSFTASQVSAGRKNRLNIEIYGSRSSVSWDQERPEELWIGNRDTNNQFARKEPAYSDLPPGHTEGYADTFKQIFCRFYQAEEYPQFADGLRQMILIEAELASNAAHAWIEVGN